MGGVAYFQGCERFIVDTYFNPDEFGKVQKLLTILYLDMGICPGSGNLCKLRGATHPLVLFGIHHKVLQIFGLDSPLAVTYSPRIVQGLLAGVCDVYIQARLKHSTTEKYRNLPYFVQFALGLLLLLGKDFF